MNWRLEIERFLPGGSLSCCLAVHLASAGSAVLKVSGSWAPAELDGVALRHWNGGPAPFLIRADDDGDALLLESASLPAHDSTMGRATGISRAPLV